MRGMWIGLGMMIVGGGSPCVAQGYSDRFWAAGPDADRVERGAVRDWMQAKPIVKDVLASRAFANKFRRSREFTPNEWVACLDVAAEKMDVVVPFSQLAKLCSE